LLKQRLLNGEFGRPICATVMGCWPRGDAYFKRNEWAGRLMRNGRWVLDSPAANALAHFLHLALYLLGSEMQEAASPESVSAELYRANDIENYDTCSLRLALPGDVPLYVAYTHACSETVEPMVTIETERAVIRYLAYRSIEIRMNDGTRQRLVLSDKPHAQMLQTFQRALRERGSRSAGASLEMSRAHVVAVNVASEAGPVVDVPPQHVQHIHDSEDNVVRTIDQIVAAVKASAERKCMLHETGMLPWARVAHTKGVADYAHFGGPWQSKSAAQRLTPASDMNVDPPSAPLRRAAAVK